MKYLLTTLNAKFSHSSLAIRYLKKYCEGHAFEPEIMEFTINQHVDDIVRQIMMHHYDVVIFSSYIWNYEMSLKIAEDLKTINPEIKIVFGGPEVSYDPINLLEQHHFIDIIMFGEGERTYFELMSALDENKSLEAIKGIAYRGNQIVQNEKRALIDDLDEVPFPYSDLSDLEHRKIYYESSRGCPFNCQYCLSSTTGRVRFFSLERVKQDLKFFIDEKVDQVKFVDRTFNANPKRALEIMRFLHENDNQKTNFHFEIVASLLNDETIEFLKKVRIGLFQFEIGVQTTNHDTMIAIKRNIDFNQLSEAVIKLSDNKNIHLHLDLIAGLPYEPFQVFLNSFERVMALKPEKLQLGFLKLLKGSGLRVNANAYGYVFSKQAPYEIFYNHYISYDELITLKFVEEIVEIYYNSKRFKYALDMIIEKHYNRAVDFYLEFSKYWLRNDLFEKPHKISELYQTLMNFYLEKAFDKLDVFKEVLMYDYYENHPKLTDVFEFYPDKNFNNLCYSFLKDHNTMDETLSPKQWLKRSRFIVFKINILDYILSNYEREQWTTTVIMFDYEGSNKIFNRAVAYNVTDKIKE
ncbi:MAG: DUF4080 domain-containing protein [Clostridia bacterium]|nr:DUF4080 domain-containing protein [Clostridia bacterium]